MMGELWRVYRVAKLLDVSKKRVYQMVQEGKIDAVRLGPRHAEPAVGADLADQVAVGLVGADLVVADRPLHVDE